MRDLSRNRLCIQAALDFVQTLGARLLPAVEGMPAEITGARGNTVRVETSILVKRNEMRSVRGAKDVTTVTAVVSTQEQTKGRAAGGRVAVGRGRIRLLSLAPLSCVSRHSHTPFVHHFGSTTSSDVYKPGGTSRKRAKKILTFQ